jgi:hypothetical protein
LILVVSVYAPLRLWIAGPRLTTVVAVGGVSSIAEPGFHPRQAEIIII